MRSCELGDCNEKHVAKGLCDAHRHEAKRLGVQASVQGLATAQGNGASAAKHFGGDPYGDSLNKPWEASTKLAQSRARGQRDSLEEAAQVALDAFPLATDSLTPAFGQAGWSTGTHMRCGWPETALRAFMQQGIEEYLDNGGPQECLDGHAPVRV